MKITVDIDVTEIDDCWNGGGFSSCQHLGQEFRSKTQSVYFICRIWNHYLVPLNAYLGKPIKPCMLCLDARDKETSQ